MADETQHVGYVAAAGALHVVGVHGPAVDRGDRVLELGRLVQAVGVQRDAHAMRVGVAQHGVDQLGIGAVVLVDLEAHGTRVEQGVERRVGRRPGVRLQAQVDGPVLERAQRALHGPRRLLEAGRDERGHAAGERGGDQLGRDQVDVAVHRARGGHQAVADDGLGVRADGQVDAVADRRVAGRADAHDPAVLDADVRLHHAQHRVDDDRADQDRVELARVGLAGLHLAQPDRLAVAPQRLVAVRLAVLLDGQPQVRIGNPDAIAGRGPQARAEFVGVLHCRSAPP